LKKKGAGMASLHGHPRFEALVGNDDVKTERN
jgi:hypothetical protein